MALPLIYIAAPVAAAAIGGYFLMRKKKPSAGTPGNLNRPTDGVHDDYGAGLSDGANDGTNDGKAGFAMNPRPLINYSGNASAQKNYETGYTIGYNGAYASAFALSKISTDSVDPGGTPTVEEAEVKKPSTGADRTLGQKDGQAYGYMMGQMAAISASGGGGVDQATAKDNAKRDSGWQFGTKNFAYNQGWEEGFNTGWSTGVASVMPSKTSTSGFFTGRTSHSRHENRAHRPTIDMGKVRRAHRTGSLGHETARRLAMALHVRGFEAEAKEVRTFSRETDPHVGAMEAQAAQQSKLPPWFKPGSPPGAPAP